MDVGESFGYVFRDEKWLTKVLIGGIVSAIPVAGLAAIGYVLRTLRNVATGDVRPLPDWGEFGDHFVKGLMVFTAGLIYAIPVILLAAIAAIVAAVAGVGSDQATLAGVLLIGGLAALAGVYTLVLALWLPAATASYSLSGEFGDLFAFARIWALIARNPSSYIVALLVAWLAALVASAVGGILCGIGTLFTGFWAGLVYAYTLGRHVRANREALPGGTS